MLSQNESDRLLLLESIQSGYLDQLFFILVSLHQVTDSDHRYQLELRILESLEQFFSQAITLIQVFKE